MRSMPRLGPAFYRRGRIIELGGHRGRGGTVQAQVCSAFEALLETLKAAGGQAGDLAAVYSAHSEFTQPGTDALCKAFRAAQVRPTWTPVGVCPFEDPDCLVEIRGTAVIGGKRQVFSTSEDEGFYAHCLRVEDLCFVSGQHGEDPISGQMPDDQLIQVTNAFHNVDLLIKRAGGLGWPDVAHYTSWSVGEYSAMIPQCRQLARESARLNPSQPCWTFLGANALLRGRVCVVPDLIEFGASIAPRHNPGAVGQRNSAEYKYEQGISLKEQTVLSGQGAWNIDDVGEPLPQLAMEQLPVAMKNIEVVLCSASARWNQVFALHVYVVGQLLEPLLAKLENIATNTWPGNPPEVRPVIMVTSVSTLAFREMLIEIQAIAKR